MYFEQDREVEDEAFAGGEREQQSSVKMRLVEKLGNCFAKVASHYWMQQHQTAADGGIAVADSDP